ncbi:MAG: hypothetical protein AAFP76_05180 [Bacteroidota bacterium]
MRAYIYFVLAITAMFFMSCSVEYPEDSLIPEGRLMAEPTRNIPFIIRGYGDMTLTPPHITHNTECDGLTLIETEGVSTEATFGRFTTRTRICTNREDYYMVRGVHHFPDGDELFFHSVQYVETEGHVQHTLVFNKGTGQFAGATGTVILNEEINFHDIMHGTYTFEGEGTLIIPR